VEVVVEVLGFGSLNEMMNDSDKKTPIESVPYRPRNDT